MVDTLTYMRTWDRNVLNFLGDKLMVFLVDTRKCLSAFSLIKATFIKIFHKIYIHNASFEMCRFHGLFAI